MALIGERFCELIGLHCFAESVVEEVESPHVENMSLIIEILR